jgi:hypothetical protein
MNELETLKNEIEFWKEFSRQTYIIREEKGGWCIFKGETMMPVAYPSHNEAAKTAKKLLGWNEQSKFIEKFPKKTRYRATVLYNDGYGKQCMELGPVEAGTKEEAQGKLDEEASQFFADRPNADIIEVRVKQQR